MSATTITSTGRVRAHSHFLRDEASMTTNSTVKAIQIAQLTTPAASFQLWPSDDSSTTITGITSRAAIKIGISKKRSARAARSSMARCSTRCARSLRPT